MITEMMFANITLNYKYKVLFNFLALYENINISMNNFTSISLTRFVSFIFSIF